MTQDTQAGAGAQPAPAIQPESLSLTPAEVALTRILRIVQTYLPPDSDKSAHEALSDIIAEVDPWPLEMAPLRHLERQHAELSAVQAEAKHWRTNHDNVVARLRIFTQRPDIPKELADRLPWYLELVRLQAAEAQALQQSAEITDAAIDRIAESMPGGLDGFLKAWGWRQFARAILQAAPPAPAAVAVPDGFGTAEHWKEKAQYWADVAHRLRGEALRGEPVDGIVHPAQEHATQLAGQGKEHRPNWLPFSVRTQIAQRHGTKVTAAFNKLVRDVIETYIATHDAAPAQAQEDAPDPVRALIATHAEMLEDNAYAYFELAYTRQTGWMAWITDKPLYGAQVVNTDRKVLAKGQGDTPDEACADAARAAQGAPA